MITSSDPRVTYSDLQWPTVTYSDLQWPTVTLRWPILTLHTSSYLYLPHLIHTGLNHGDLEKYGGRKVVVVVVATKFNVKHQGKVYHHPPSTIHKWPLSDLPRSNLCPSLSLSFTIQAQMWSSWAKICCVTSCRLRLMDLMIKQSQNKKRPQYMLSSYKNQNPSFGNLVYWKMKIV